MFCTCLSAPSLAVNGPNCHHEVCSVTLGPSSQCPKDNLSYKVDEVLQHGRMEHRRKSSLIQLKTSIQNESK